MSVAVSYSTLQPVPRSVASRLVAEAEALPPPVWYEPIRLATEGEDPALVHGWSKGPPMSVELTDGSVIRVSEVDWAFMDYWDFLRLVTQLADWSRRFGVDWRLTVEGEGLGTIKAGRFSWTLRRHLRSLARVGGAGRSDETDAVRAEELRRRYPAFEASGADPRG